MLRVTEYKAFVLSIYLCVYVYEYFHGFIELVINILMLKYNTVEKVNIILQRFGYKIFYW